jgi:hypothetical protein
MGDGLCGEVMTCSFTGSNAIKISCAEHRIVLHGMTHHEVV